MDNLLNSSHVSSLIGLMTVVHVSGLISIYKVVCSYKMTDFYFLL